MRKGRRRRCRRVRGVRPRLLHTMVIVVCFLRMRPRHGVGNGVRGQRRQTSVAVVGAMTEQMVLMLVRNSGDVFVSLNLRRRRSQEVDIHCVPVVISSKRPKVCWHMGTVGRMDAGERVRR